MKVRLVKGIPKHRTDLLCLFALEDGAKAAAATPGRDTGTIFAAMRGPGGIAGEGKTRVFASPDNGNYGGVAFVGVGREDEVTGDTVRVAAGTMASKAKEFRAGKFCIVVPADLTDRFSMPEVVAWIVEGAKMSLYRFERFKSAKQGAVPDLTVAVQELSAEARGAARTAGIIADGAIFAKETGNLPPNECSPADLARTARALAKRNKMRCSIISEPELRKRGFGGICAVGGGSKNRPKLIQLEYRGAAAGERPVVLVGKAVTFDTGGISLKPRAAMDEMKFDKCGGCAVLGVMKAVSELGLRANVVGIIPSVENMPGGEAYRPGDIIRLYSKKTAEILNTDAEGRLILADALAYGEQRYSPRAIIDLATLTGASVVALGPNVAAMFSNDRGLADGLARSSGRTAERVWEMPLDPDYSEMIASDVADMRNMGIGRAAGAITAAAFLKNAIKETPWAHIDIAGVAWTQEATREKPYNPKGATGFGVRLITDYLQTLQKGPQQR